MANALVLLPTNTYRAADVLRAGESLGVRVVVGTDRPQALETATGDTSITLPFHDLAVAVERARSLHQRVPLDGVVGLDDETVLAAAAIAEHLDLPGNRPSAVSAASDKAAARDAYSAAGLPGPAHRVVPLHEIADHVAQQEFPCVLKPTFLSASRGVIRADGPAEFLAAADRIAAILANPDVHERAGSRADVILVETYLPGDEIAIDGMVIDGRFEPVVVFDKPTPLTGPFFEETLYVTPSRHDRALLDRAVAMVRRGTRALGLEHGSIHAELRLHEGEATLLEVAPRPIGGLCPRIVPLATRVRLEELALCAALGRPLPRAAPQTAAGVMMLPVPSEGVLERVDGLDAARAIDGVVGLEIAVPLGQRVVPLPEGNRYLGFIFAQTDLPEHAEEQLIEAHKALRIVIR